MTFLKIFNEKENHHGFQYQDGLNTDTKPFNNNPDASCVEGGLYFSDEKNVLRFINYGIWIQEVEPKGDVVLDPKGDKWRAESLFLHQRKDLRKIETWKWLNDKGVDIHAGKDFALRWAAENGHLEIVEFLVEKGADIHAGNDFALRWAAENGHLEIVKFLVEKMEQEK